jgi:hypothetical protein
LVPVGSEFIRFQIWDMARQEKFKAISRAYFRNAVRAVLVFDLTDLSPFNAMSKWLGELHSNCVPSVYILVIVRPRTSGRGARQGPGEPQNKNEVKGFFTQARTETGNCPLRPVASM